MSDFLETMARDKEKFDKALRSLARSSLTDFDYPTPARRREDVEKLADHILEAIDGWINENCEF